MCVLEGFTAPLLWPCWSQPTWPLSGAGSLFGVQPAACPQQTFPVTGFCDILGTPLYLWLYSDSSKHCSLKNSLPNLPCLSLKSRGKVPWPNSSYTPRAGKTTLMWTIPSQFPDQAVTSDPPGSWLPCSLSAWMAGHSKMNPGEPIPQEPPLKQASQALSFQKNCLHFCTLELVMDWVLLLTYMLSRYFPFCPFTKYFLYY